MQEAGVNLVSLGIFSWSRLQPGPNEFDFEWLDRVMHLLNEGGIKVDLATATASPPPWLTHQHPEMLPTLADGARLWPGARQHYCPSSPVYREAARSLVERLSARYKDHPALVMWHVGNEYGCHVAACYCDVSAIDFRTWLRARYGSLEELNRAWGTDFWSQRYSDWEEILPPRQAPTWPNPGQCLDFLRFSSDALLACYEIERTVLSRVTPGIPITTNFMRFFKPLDYWKWAVQEDIVSDDVYQDPSEPEASSLESAMAGDLMRSLGQGRPWILLEQTTSRVNWRPVNVPKRPGQMRLWSFQAVAHGADGVMFFQWRQSRSGAEKFHSAMVPHGPVESWPAWREVVQLGAELGRLDALCGSRVPAEVAIVFDWESWWALEQPSKPSANVRALEQARAYYEHLYRANISADFAHPEADLKAYKLVLVPNLYLVSDAAAAGLAAYVSGGGRLVMSYFSGIVDPADQIRLGGYPAPFVELLGLRVEDFAPLAVGETIPVRFEAGQVATGQIWSELIRPAGAEVLARFEAGPLKGEPAVLRHTFGSGVAHYIGTTLDSIAMGALLEQARMEAGVTSVAALPSGVEAVRRQGDSGSFLFLLNHRDAEVEVEAAPGLDALTGERIDGGRLRLPAYGVAIIKEDLAEGQ